MADDGLIEAYLRELRFSVATLPDADDIVAEALDHLLEALERHDRDSRSRAEIEAEVIARFGSAALVSRVCMSEAKRGAAVPTTRTRHAGLAAVVAPVLLVIGQSGNLAIEEGAGHGVAVFALTLSFPALAYGLWGLRARHGGLGRLGKAALVLALASPVLSMAASYAAIFALALLLSVAMTVFAVEMLRASVLPVAPLTLFAAGPLGVLVLGAVALGITMAGGDAGELPIELVASPVAIASVGFAWLGWHLWREPAVDHPTQGHRALAG
ncbi:MAG: hypothetical protein ACOYXM_15415 [Actinomycetota bacterium]